MCTQVHNSSSQHSNPFHLPNNILSVSLFGPQTNVTTIIPPQTSNVLHIMSQITVYMFTKSTKHTFKHVPRETRLLELIFNTSCSVQSIHDYFTYKVYLLTGMFIK